MNNTNIPVYIYLDQNKWIELAKGIRNKESKYETLYREMKSNVESNIWAFPLSIIHIAESMKRKDEESRKNLLNLMYSLSKGYSISDCATANIIEFNYWVSNGMVDYKQIQNKIISNDLSKIIGLSTADTIVKINGDTDISDEQIKYIKDLIVKHSFDKEIFEYICEQCSSFNEDEDFYYNCFETARKDFMLWKEQIKKLDEYKEKHVYPAYLIKTFFEEYGEIMSRLSSLNKHKIKLLFDNNTQNKEKSIKLLESLPGFNIYNRLVYELLSNQCKKIHKHDFFDLAFLRVAVPYCDIVIGENYWIDRIQYYKLDQQYKTVTTTKLLELGNLRIN